MRFLGTLIVATVGMAVALLVWGDDKPAKEREPDGKYKGKAKEPEASTKPAEGDGPAKEGAA